MGKHLTLDETGATAERFWLKLKFKKAGTLYVSQAFTPKKVDDSQAFLPESHPLFGGTFFTAPVRQVCINAAIACLRFCTNSVLTVCSPGTADNR